MIVLDPGQGGHSTTDSYGSSGVPESQVNLALAWRVAEHLGQEVALTRTGDVGIGLGERLELIV